MSIILDRVIQAAQAGLELTTCLLLCPYQVTLRNSLKLSKTNQISLFLVETANTDINYCELSYDLIDSTSRNMMLKHSESFPDPNTVHVELVKNQDVERLSFH